MSFPTTKCSPARQAASAWASSLPLSSVQQSGDLSGAVVGAGLGLGIDYFKLDDKMGDLARRARWNLKHGPSMSRFYNRPRR